MKKIILSVLVIAFSINMFAALNLPVSYFTVKVTSANGGIDEVLMAEGNYTMAFDNGYDANKTYNVMAPNINVNMYAIAQFGNVSKLAVPENTLEGTYIGFQANATETEYTISFNGLKLKDGRTPLYFEDVNNDSIFEITPIATYTFTCAKGVTLANRFRIYKPFSGDEGELDICYQYGDLTINNNPYTTNIVVKDEDGQVVLDKMARTTPQVISLSALTKGEKYQVIVGDKTMIIRVQ